MGNPVAASTLAIGGYNGALGSTQTGGNTPISAATFMIAKFISSATANNHCALIPSGAVGAGTAGAQYKVSASKTFVSPGFYWTSSLAVNTSFIGFGYGTAALIALDTATAPTGAVYYSGATTVRQFNNVSGATGFVPVLALQWMPFPMSFPANSFPFFQTMVNADQLYIQVVGTEI